MSLDDYEDDESPRCDECGSATKCYLGCSWNAETPAEMAEPVRASDLEEVE